MIYLSGFNQFFLVINLPVVCPLIMLHNGGGMRRGLLRALQLSSRGEA